MRMHFDEKTGHARSAPCPGGNRKGKTGTVRRRMGAGIALLLLSLWLCACGGGETEETETVPETVTETPEETLPPTTEEETEPVIDRSQKIYYQELVASYPSSFEFKLQEGVRLNGYYDSAFRWKDGRKIYTDSRYRVRTGIDVSRHQGDIDWEAVKADGIEFAFLRAGYRGYGWKGTLNEDSTFRANLKGALDAGLDVGVYFFSQAITEEEALEEAEYALSLLDGAELTLPIVYDPEFILNDDARNDGTGREEFTRFTRIFCERVREAGYDAMIYCNILWESDFLDMAALGDLPVWYAGYENVPRTPYHFDFWQYNENGKVKGIEGGVDMDLQFIPQAASGVEVLMSLEPPATEPAETTAAETTAAETSAGETSAAETSAGETSAAETTPAEGSAAETSPAETTSAEGSAAETSPAETTPAEGSAEETSPAETSPAEGSAAETSPAETTSSEGSTAETTASGSGTVKPAVTSPVSGGSSGEIGRLRKPSWGRENRSGRMDKTQ